MNFFLLNLLCISSALGGLVKSPLLNGENGGYKQGQVYEYDIDQHVLTGIPLGTTVYSGFKIVGKLILAPISTSSGGLHMGFKLDNIKIKRKTDGLKTGLRPDECLPVSEFRDIDYDVDSSVKSELYGQLEKSWSVKFEGGNVEQVLFVSGDSEWSKNIKKGIVNMGNFNMYPDTTDCVTRDDVGLPNSKLHTTTHSHSSGSKSCDLDYQGPGTDVHNRVYEDGVGGSCETEYTMIRVPSGMNPSGQETYNISKVRNYENCRTRPTSTSFDFFDLSSIDKSEKTFLRSPTKTQINLIGTPDNYIFDKIVMSGQHIYTPFEEKEGSATTFTHFQMVFMGESSNNPSWLDQPTEVDQNGLWYLFEEVDFVDSSMDQNEKLSLLKNLLGKIVDPSDVELTEPETGGYILQAFQIMRTFNDRDFDKFYTTYCTSDEFTKTFFDLLPSVGTTYSTGFLIKCLKDSSHSIYNLMNTLEIHMVLGLLGKTPSTTIDNVDDLWDLCNTFEQSMTSFIGSQTDLAPLSHTCYLSYTNMLNGLCQCEFAPIQTTGQRHVPRRYNYEKTCNQTQCTPSILLTRVQKIMNDLQTVLKEPGRMACVYAHLQSLQNLDMLPHSVIRDISGIILDHTLPLTVRATAIYSISKAGRYNQDLINDILMPIYHDPTEDPELRVACFEVMIKSAIYNDPSVVRHLVQNIPNEPSYVLRSFVYSTIKSFADIPPEDCQVVIREICQVCRECMHLMTPTEQGYTYINVLPFGGRFNGLGVNLVGKFFSVQGNESFVPKVLGFRSFGDFSGLHSEIINVGIHTQGLDGLPELLLNQKVSGHSFSKPDEIKNVDVKTIKNKQSERPGMTIWFNWMDSSLFVWTLDFTKVSKLLNIHDVMKKLDNIKLDMKKRMIPVYHYYTIPTELGIPIYKDLRLSTIFDLSGDLNIQTTPQVNSISDLIVKGVDNVKVTGQTKTRLNTRVSSRHYVRLHRILSGLNLDVHFGINKPIECVLDVNPKSREIQKSFTFQDDLVIKTDVKPVAFMRDMMKGDDQMIIEQNLVSDDGVEFVDINGDICEINTPQGYPYMPFCGLVKNLPFSVKVQGRVCTNYFPGRYSNGWPVGTPQTFNMRVNMKSGVGNKIQMTWQWQNSNDDPSVMTSKFGLKPLDLPSGSTFKPNYDIPKHHLKLLKPPTTSSSGDISTRILLRVKGDQESDDKCFNGQLLWTRKIDWTESTLDLQCTRPEPLGDIKPFDLCGRYEYTTTNEISVRDLYNMDVEDLMKVNKDLTANEKFEVRFGDKCKRNPIISGTGTGKKTPDWYNYQERSLSEFPEYVQCQNDLNEGLTMVESMSCLRLVLFVNTLDDVTGQITWGDDLGKPFRKVCVNFYETWLKPFFLRTLWGNGWNKKFGQDVVIDPIDGQGRSGEIVYTSKTCPRSQTTNFTLTTPIDTLSGWRFPMGGPVVLSPSYYHRGLIDPMFPLLKNHKKTQLTVPKTIVKSLVKRSVCKIKNDKYSSSKDKVFSLDKFSFDLPELSYGKECYTVLSSDCSPFKQYSIYMKRVSSTGKKDVLIYLKDKKVELISDSSSMTVKVDGDVVDLTKPYDIFVQKDGDNTGSVIPSIEHKPTSISWIPELDTTNIKSSMVSLMKSIYGDHTDLGKDDLIVISKPSDKVVVLSSPSLDLEVRTDGKDISILTPITVMNKHCGICGNYNLQKFDDKTGPDGKLHSDIKSFYSSFTSKDSKKCDLDY